jgi:hypothetical protein
VTGDIVLSEFRDPATSRLLVSIDRADPRAEVDGLLMRRIAADECEPWATFGNDPTLQTLHIADDFGRRFIYRIRGYDAERDVFAVEWPD